MEVFLDMLIDSLKGAILISGLVVVMMMMIELVNINSHGSFSILLRRSKVGQVFLSAILGAVPGCMGGFAAVSLYTHGIFSFGALVAMMIASSGDEAFVMLALIPQKAVWITAILLVIAICVGLLVDLLYHPSDVVAVCEDKFSIHHEDEIRKKETRHFTWKRALMFFGVLLFIVALISGMFEHEEHGSGDCEGGINLLSEEWMYWLFGILSLAVLAVLLLGKDHFIEEHLWHHIVCKHLHRVFLWTFGVLILLGFGMQYLDIQSWVSDNVVIMILLATLIGIIPESGPHLIFVTLYASGIIPLSVLLASCISQDGHASLPLLAETKKGFVLAKVINCVVALIVGYVSLLFL